VIPVALSQRRRWDAVVAVFLVALLTVLFFRTMDRDLNHDEHQFLAPAALLSREGLLPYRDYPLFHLPNLVFLYAAGDYVLGSPILSAKLFSFFSSAGMLGLLCWIGYRASRAGKGNLFAAVSLPLLLFFDPVFYYTAGKTWNHEVPSFLTVAAILLQVAAVRRRLFWLAVISGCAGGLAVGSRLTFAPILLPLFVAPLFHPGTWRDRLLLMWWSGVGMAGGLFPSFVLFLQSPDNFLFGNLEFPRLRLLDPENTRIQKTMRLSAKLRYFFKEIIVPSLPLYLAFFAMGVRPGWKWLRKQSGGDFCAALILLCLPFALAGCFAPSRYQYQHYFGVNCLIAFGAAAGLYPTLEAFSGRWGSWPRLALPALACASIALAFLSTDKKQRFEVNFEKPSEWYYVRARRIGEEVKAHAPNGPILTLAPAWPIEAGLTIYPEFASGPFGWRSAPFAAQERRKASHLIAPEDLESIATRRPPAAILAGVEDKELEKPLIDYAKQRGWQRIKLSKRRELWLPIGVPMNKSTPPQPE
jgi:hypothetical protein